MRIDRYPGVKKRRSHVACAGWEQQQRLKRQRQRIRHEVHWRQCRRARTTPINATYGNSTVTMHAPTPSVYRYTHLRVVECHREGDVGVL